MSQIDLEVSDRIARYLAGQSSLAEFRRWLLPIVWELAEPTSDERSDLANMVELRMAEFMNGHWTEADLRLLLARMLPSTSSLVSDLTLRVSGVVASGPAKAVRTPTDFIPSA
jgi:hypothetical protein